MKFLYATLQAHASSRWDQANIGSLFSGIKSFQGTYHCCASKTIADVAYMAEWDLVGMRDECAEYFTSSSGSGSVAMGSSTTTTSTSRYSYGVLFAVCQFKVVLAAG